MSQGTFYFRKLMAVSFKTFLLFLFLFQPTSTFAKNKITETYPHFIPEKYRCQTDSDCTLSCREGAINRSYSKKITDDCEDGCSSKGMKAQCIHYLCEAFRWDGKKEESCTLKENKK